jgi:hypothetical protein
MRNLRAELQNRADFIAQQIRAENARFESLVSQLRADQATKLDHLRAQLRLANKLVEFAAWEQNVRTTLAAHIAAAEAAKRTLESHFPDLSAISD